MLLLSILLGCGSNAPPETATEPATGSEATSVTAETPPKTLEPPKTIEVNLTGSATPVDGSDLALSEARASAGYTDASGHLHDAEHLIDLRTERAWCADDDAPTSTVQVACPAETVPISAISVVAGRSESGTIWSRHGRPTTLSLSLSDAQRALWKATASLLDVREEQFLAVDGVECPAGETLQLELTVSASTPGSRVASPCISEVRVLTSAEQTNPEPPVTCQARVWADPSSGSLNIRGGPGTTHPVLGQFSEGTIFNPELTLTHARDGSWLRYEKPEMFSNDAEDFVAMKDLPAKGWVFGALLSTGVQFIFEGDTPRLTLHTGPNAETRRVFSPSDPYAEVWTVDAVLDCEGPWLRVRLVGMDSGKKAVGWLPPEMQCQNQFTGCS